MARIFKTPFGAQGDTEQVPEAPQGDGSVSLTQGFGYDYEREYEDPAAKDIRREVMNGLFHDVTEAIGDIQLSGVAKWSADAAPYPAGAVVWNNNSAWFSTSGNNNSVPGAGNWKAVDLSSSIRLSESIEQVPSANNVQEALAGLGAFAGDGYQNIAVFDTAGVTNWTVPDVLRLGLRKAHVSVTGGGGGGGRIDGPVNSTGGGGGGGGGVAEDILNLSGVSSVTVTVGAGGAGRATDGSGGIGGSSSFGVFMSASGGGGGTSSGGGGNSGAGAGGSLNGGLGDGGNGMFSQSALLPSGGGGGGPGGRGFVTGANPGRGPGGGGGGSGSGVSENGADGMIVVRW